MHLKDAMMLRMTGAGATACKTIRLILLLLLLISLRLIGLKHGCNMEVH